MKAPHPIQWAVLSARRPGLTKFEHEVVRTDSGDLGISVSEADLLGRLSAVYDGFCVRGYQSVKLQQYCGVVSIGERSLEVLPKTRHDESVTSARNTFVHLLREASEIPLHLTSRTDSLVSDGDLLDVFVRYFLEEVMLLVSQGLMRKYEPCEDDIGFVRGRIGFARQFGANANRKDRINCHFDEFTADNKWNRVIKYGLRIVQPWISSSSTYRLWAELRWTLDEVSDLNSLSSADLGRAVYDRKSDRYRTAIEWVDWLIQRLSPKARAGDKSIKGILFDMNKVFEAAIARTMARQLRDFEVDIQSKTSIKYFAHLTPTPTPVYRVIPDILIRDAHGLRAIVDTKWKNPTVGPDGFIRPNEADMYQMSAYAATFDCSELFLIYPWRPELSAAKETRFTLATSSTRQSNLTVICVDVTSKRFPTRLGPDLATHLSSR